MKKLILVMADVKEDPNADKMTIIEMDGDDIFSMNFHSESGFTARDIYNLLANA